MNSTRLPPAGYSAQGNVVYLIDDDRSVGRSLARLLTLSKWNVRSFESAEAFLAELDTLPSGCLVLDIQLPGMSGLELLERLQQMRLAWPAVAMSGSGDESVSHEALRLGAGAFLPKPFDPKILLELLEQMALSADTRQARSSGQ